jgi:hypothetical protein
VAFDVGADKFDFVREVHGTVVGASNGAALRASLNQVYRGKILAEALDAGETLADSLTDSARDARRSRTGSDTSTQRKR